MHTWSVLYIVSRELKPGALQIGWVHVDHEPLVYDLSPRLMPNEAMQLSCLGQTDVTYQSQLSQSGQVNCFLVHSKTLFHHTLET